MNKDKVLAALENYKLNATEEQKKKDLEILEKCCSMEQINNIEVYNSGMAKSIEDKLWFTQFLTQPQFKNATIVDYGCGNGTLIRELEVRFPYRFTYFGVDNNEEMLKLALKNQTYTGSYNRYFLEIHLILLQINLKF